MVDSNHAYGRHEALQVWAMCLMTMICVGMKSRILKIWQAMLNAGQS